MNNQEYIIMPVVFNKKPTTMPLHLYMMVLIPVYMVSKKAILEIMEENREIGKYVETTIPRDITGEILKFLESPHVIVITGVRRSGKSTIMMQVFSEIAVDNKLYINFEDERLEGVKAKDLEDIYSSFIESTGKTSKAYLFLDEIQEVAGWEKWVRRKYDGRSSDIKFIISGSNSSLMSSEFSTLLTGRNITFSVFPFSFKELGAALKGAIWELPIPPLILAGIYTGFCTATEAASLTVVYVLFIKTLVFKELSIRRDIPMIMLDSMKMVGGIMIILGAALGFTNFMVDAFIPMRILAFFEGIIQHKVAFLLIMNLFLILVGCVMDIFSAILVVVPLITPLALRFGVDPVHLGVIFLANLGIGYNTPPVGLNLFITSSRFERPMIKLYRATLPFLFLLLLALLVITYWPPLSLFLPSLLKS